MADPAPGVNAPNYTQTPNEIFDLMPDMDQSELRVVLVVCRQTFGWHKQRDRISLSQLIKATGLSRQGVLNGIEKAISRGLLKRKKVGQHPNGRPLHTYELIVKPVDQQPAEMVYSVDHDSQLSRPSIVNPVDQQKKDLKKLAKETDNGVMANGAIRAQPPVPDSSITEETDSQKEPTEQQRWFQAVCDAVGWDHRLLTKEKKGRVAQYAGKLKGAGYTLSDMSAFQDWWFKKDFRGLKGSYPTIDQLLTEIGKSRATRKVDNYPTEEERAAYLRQTRREQSA